MEFIPDKPYTSVDEQINILKQRGLKFHNIDDAKKTLENIGYYSLINGYSKPYESEGKYKNGTYFEHIVFQYIIDETLKKHLLNGMLIIENKLRNNVAEVIARNYGVYDKTKDDYGAITTTENSYLEKNNFQNKKITTRTIRDLKKTRNECNTNPTMYYRKNKNHIPPWILLKNISFWNVISLYKIMKNPLKGEVIKYFNRMKQINDDELRKQTFYESFEIIREFRNSCAHSSLFYSKKAKKRLQFKAIESVCGPNVVTSKEYNHGSLGKNDLFSLMICLVMITPESLSLMQDFIMINEYLKKANIDYLGKNPIEDFLEFSGLPANWFDRISSALYYLN